MQGALQKLQRIKLKTVFLNFNQGNQVPSLMFLERINPKNITVMIPVLNPLLELKNTHTPISLCFTPDSLEEWTNFLNTDLVKNLSSASLNLGAIFGGIGDKADLSFPKLKQLIISTQHKFGENLTERLKIKEVRYYT